MRKKTFPTDVALLALRVTTGALLAGHGAQKMFGWFGGKGLEGTAKMLDSMGLKPGEPWAIAAGTTEMGGGLLMALGLLNPIGPLGVIGAMTMATVKAHWGKPIWVTSGGAELPVINIAVALALAEAGPGKYSLDQALGTKLPRWLIAPGIAGALATGAFGLQTNKKKKQQPAMAEQAPAR